MKTSYAILTLAAVGVAHLVQRERHQRQNNDVAAARIHQEWLTHLTTHPEFAKLWVPQDLQVEEYIELLSGNQQVAALSLRHRLGLLRGARLRVVAEEVMDREIARRYWARFGNFREREAAGHRTEERFNAAMQDAYVARPESEPVGV